MEIKDITKEQLEALILLRSLEEFITDEEESLSCFSDVVCTYADNLETKDFERLARDICSLTKAGYVVSDMTGITEEELEFNTFPAVEGITPKGRTALEELEQGVKKELEQGKKTVLFENFTLFHFDASLLGGVELSLFKEAGGLFKAIKKGIGL